MHPNLFCVCLIVSQDGRAHHLIFYLDTVCLVTHIAAMRSGKYAHPKPTSIPHGNATCLVEMPVANQIVICSLEYPPPARWRSQLVCNDTRQSNAEHHSTHMSPQQICRSLERAFLFAFRLASGSPSGFGDLVDERASL